MLFIVKLSNLTTQEHGLCSFPSESGNCWRDRKHNVYSSLISFFCVLWTARLLRVAYVGQNNISYNFCVFRQENQMFLLRTRLVTNGFYT